MDRREEHIMAGVSSSPSNKKILREAARMAEAFQGTFTAVYVETPRHDRISGEDRKRLEENMREAERLGASVQTMYGDDVAVQLAEYAKLSGATKLVIGRSTIMKGIRLRQKSLTDRLIELAPQLDVYIIPDQTVSSAGFKERIRNMILVPEFGAKDIAVSILVLFAATMVGFVFDRFDFSESNIIMIYIVGVLLVAVLTGGQIHSIISSVVSVLLFNFFFIEPRFTMIAFDKEYPVTFLVMFAVAFISGTLAGRLKRNASQSAQAAYRTQILFDTNRLLERAKEQDEIIRVTAGQITRLLNRNVTIYPCKDDAADNQERNGKIRLPIRLNDTVYGVLEIDRADGEPESFEKSVLLSILGECSFALENEKNRREKEEATAFAIKEQLRANLLRSISHDLRTPLTSISGNASNLISNGDQLDANTRLRLYTDIYDDSMWLVSLVENLLFVTRIEDGRMNIRMQPELIDEVIGEAARHMERIGKNHVIRVRKSEEILMAKMDAKLITQVVINLIDNAIKYTEKGSVIEIVSSGKNGKIEVSVSDNGPGVPDEEKEHIFDIFYTGERKVTDGRRSLGLGLFLCKSIVTAHGGQICVTDHQPCGTVFSFTLQEYEPCIIPEESTTGGMKDE